MMEQEKPISKKYLRDSSTIPTTYNKAPLILRKRKVLKCLQRSVRNYKQEN